MNRRKLIKGMVSLVLAERLISLNTLWAAGKTPVAPGLHEFSGTVTVNGQTARAGMPIKPGDTIVTGPNSQAIYVIGKDAYLQRDKSTIQIFGESARSGLRVVTGKLLSVFGKGEKTIETPTATIGIRGTGCYIETEPDRDYFCLCYGKAEITSGANRGHVESIETRYHDRPLYLSRSTASMMAPAEVKNHADTELVLLESLVGRIPPFYGQQNYKY